MNLISTRSIVMKKKEMIAFLFLASTVTLAAGTVLNMQGSSRSQESLMLRGARMEADACNKTEFNETGQINNTNRCDDTPCKRDDQCQSGYCVTNEPAQGFPPSRVCAQL
jgi:hypothetical protein